MQSEWPTKHSNDTKRAGSEQNQSGFYLTKRWTARDNESLLVLLIFVRFVDFVGKSSAWIRIGNPPFPAPIPTAIIRIRQRNPRLLQIPERILPFCYDLRGN